MTSPIRDRLASIPSAITPRLPGIVDDLTAMLMHDVAPLRGDESVAPRLHASIESNVSMLMHLMQHSADLPAIEAPQGAVQFAHWLAQRGLPFSAVLRLYHLANARFYEECLRELAQHSPNRDTMVDDAARLSALMHAYVDHVCERISATYDTERERWLRQQDVVRADRVRALLDGVSPSDVSETESALGYRLGGHHLAVIVWHTGTTRDGNELLRLQHLIGSCADALGCTDAPLLLPRDDATLWAWVPVPREREESEEVLTELLATPGQPVKAAIGEVGGALTGFVRSHQQALSAQNVALLAGAHAAHLTPYGDIAGISFLCLDLGRAQEWIVDVLGGLATDDSAHANLRHSLEVFLDTGGSYTAAAEILHCHKNTVQYRIRRAEAVRGRSIRNRRVDLELALLACRWLGPAVLVEGGDIRTGASHRSGEGNSTGTTT